MPVAKFFYQGLLWKGFFFITVFILNLLIARHFRASDSGQIFYLINLYAFIILITSVSLESSIGYYTARNEISINKLINFSFLWTILIAVIIFGYSIWRNNYTGINIWAPAFICGNLLSGYYTAISYAKRNFSLPNIVNIVINVLLIILLLAINFFEVEIINDETFLVIFFSSFLLQGLITGIALTIAYLPNWQFAFPTNQELKKLFRYGFVAFSANIITFLLYRVDYWFVKHYCNATDLGNYIQVSKLAQVFFILPGILAGTVFPLTAGGEQKKVNNILSILSRLIFMLYIIGCSILSITGYWLFPFLFGDTFTNMYVPFLLLIPGVLALSTLYTLTAYYAGKNKMSINIKGASIAVVFIIIADVLFIPKFGINAAALVSSAGYIIYHIWVLKTFIYEYKSSAISFFNFKFSDVQQIKKMIFNKAADDE